jgi:hypothetical protein
MAIDSERRMFCSEFCAAALGFYEPQRFSPALVAEVAGRINRLPFVQLAHQVNDDQTAVRTHHG